MPEARAERLRAGFLGREAARIARHPVSAPLAFLALHMRKYAVEKTVPESFDYPFDAADVDQIAAKAKDHRVSPPSRECFAVLEMTALVLARSAATKQSRPGAAGLAPAGISRALFRPS